MARNSSWNLRLNVWSDVRKAFLTYCWVIVEPPWVEPPVTLFQAARRIPVKEIPGSE
jgi:hypothetical protein